MLVGCSNLLLSHILPALKRKLKYRCITIYVFIIQLQIHVNEYKAVCFLNLSMWVIEKEHSPLHMIEYYACDFVKEKNLPSHGLDCPLLCSSEAAY